MNINELERLTGITKQNIRFYEKKGLLHPMRNSENNYREYSQEDLTALKTIKLLRKLDFSIEDIHKILSAQMPLHTILEQHLKELQARQQKLEACIDVCKDLLKTDTESLDLDGTFEKMEQIEQNGGKFMSIIEDYKRFAEEKRKKSFSFQPDTMVMNAEEFKEALLQYAEENQLNLTIIKEGMYPLFRIDNLEYKAERIFDRFGATIHCSLTNPEELETGLEHIPPARKRLYSFFHGPWFFLLVLFIVMAISRQSFFWAFFVLAMVGPYLFWLFIRYFR